MDSEQLLLLCDHVLPISTSYPVILSTVSYVLLLLCVVVVIRSMVVLSQCDYESKKFYPFYNVHVMYYTLTMHTYIITCS